MTTSIVKDPAAVLGNYLAKAPPDLLRRAVQQLVTTLVHESTNNSGNGDPGRVLTDESSRSVQYSLQSQDYRSRPHCESAIGLRGPNSSTTDRRATGQDIPESDTHAPRQPAGALEAAPIQKRRANHTAITEKTDDTTPLSPRPNEAECWSDFWGRLAYIWASMPPDAQQRCLARAAAHRSRFDLLAKPPARRGGLPQHVANIPSRLGLRRP